jgi:hypothetical protein
MASMITMRRMMLWVLCVAAVTTMACRGQHTDRPPATPLSAAASAYPEARSREQILAEARADGGLAKVRGPGDLTIQQHAEECRTAVGPIPAFSCLDGDLIPITSGGVDVPPGQHTSTMTCDRPVHLGLGNDGQCVPYARLGSLPSVDTAGNPDPDVNWIFICRRYKIRTDRNYPNFEDVAIIGHRKSTGATCFFQTLSEVKNVPDGLRATRVPPPTEATADTPNGSPTAEDFWLSPQETAAIRCYQCHDSDPWIHTPYVDQVKGRSSDASKPLVPDAPRIEDPLRYTFVGSQFFSDWPRPAHFAPLNNRCVACHRIGSFASSGLFASRATGLEGTPQLHPSMAQYPQSHWMPPDEPATISRQEWEGLYLQSVEQLRTCRASPTRPDCRRTTLTP